MMLTERGEALLAALEKDPEAKPWDVYPRPRMVREDWINLNGYWDFGASDVGDPVWGGQILVPFPPESALSGVEGFDAKKTPCLFYRRTFVLEELPAGKRLLLHVGGADQELAAVRFNGETILAEYNPLLNGPLCLELREPRTGENLLELEVWDYGGTDLPWGKQRDKRGGMWYTPVSGLWQTVWLEWVPATFVTEIRCTPTLEDVTVEIQMCRDKHRLSADDRNRSDNADGRVPSLQGKTADEQCSSLQTTNATILFEGKTWPVEDGKAVLRPSEPRLWTPEDPHLYEFTVLCGEDRVSSYFALRTVGTGVIDGVPRLLLNGKPYFFNGLLDQGYWSDGLWTPADPACFADDLRLAKGLGFNMVRKHIKIEPALFYYECDRLGVAVFQDLINLGPYNYLRDTVLPTIRIQRVPHLFRRRSRHRAEVFYRHMEAAARTLYSYPSVVYWTVFNEGWGQQYTTEACERMKALDFTRIVDTASGWFRIGRTDVDSRHVYFRAFRMPRSRRSSTSAADCAAGTSPHPSSGLRETPDATFPPGGRLLPRSRCFSTSAADCAAGTSPHPSSGLCETPDATFPPGGRLLPRSRRSSTSAADCAAGTSPHPSSGLRETPDATFPPGGRHCPRPVVLSEFGGYVWKCMDHSFNQEETYGYKTFEKREDWEAALQALYREQIAPAVPQGLCAAVYTQLSDVEDETNGLVTYDRRVVKPAGPIWPIS